VPTKHAVAVLKQKTIARSSTRAVGCHAYGLDHLTSKAAQGDDCTLALDGENGLRGAGEIGGARIEFTGRRRERSDFLLLNRGFHLVNEAPFNR
jgi:hypothetical protein